MIDQSTNIYKLLKELTKDVSSYYIKQKDINNYEESNGHFVYSHFKPYNGTIDSTLLEQHLHKDITLAISVKNSNILFFDYRGKTAFAFGTLLTRLLDRDKFTIYITEYSLDRLSLYIKPKNIVDLDRLRVELESALESKLPKEWRVYPIKNSPNLGNLMILPREFIESPWSF